MKIPFTDRYTSPYLLIYLLILFIFAKLRPLFNPAKYLLGDLKVHLADVGPKVNEAAVGKSKQSSHSKSGLQNDKSETVGNRQPNGNTTKSSMSSSSSPELTLSTFRLSSIANLSDLRMFYLLDIALNLLVFIIMHCSISLFLGAIVGAYPNYILCFSVSSCLFVFILLVLARIPFTAGLDSDIFALSLFVGIGSFFLTFLSFPSFDVAVDLGINTAFETEILPWLQSSPMTSWISSQIYKVALSILAGIIGFVIVLPAFRSASIFMDSLNVITARSHRRLPIIIVEFFAPAIAVLSWIPFFIKDAFFFEGNVIREDWFPKLRILLYLAIAVSRLILLPYFLQTYLNQSIKIIKNTNTHDSNEVEAVRSKIAYIVSYIVPVTLQQLTPSIVYITCVMAIKNMGDETMNFGLYSVRVTDPSHAYYVEDPKSLSVSSLASFILFIFSLLWTLSTLSAQCINMVGKW